MMSYHAHVAWRGDLPLAAVAQGAEQVGVGAAPAAARAPPPAALRAAAALAAVGAHQAVHPAARLRRLQLSCQVRQNVSRAALHRQGDHLPYRLPPSTASVRQKGRQEPHTAVSLLSDCLTSATAAQPIRISHQVLLLVTTGFQTTHTDDMSRVSRSGIWERVVLHGRGLTLEEEWWPRLPVLPEL